VSAHVDTFARDHLPPRGEWPEFVFDRPEYRHPERLNAAVELLDRAVQRGWGKRIALRTLVNGRQITCTYEQLTVQVNRIARVLVEDLKLVPGNRVLLRGPNHPLLAACWLAVVKAGLVAVGTMPLLRARELKPVIDKARISAALCDVRLKDELAHNLDPASEFFTPTLRQVLFFNDRRPGSLDTRAAAKPVDFVGCDTHRDDVALIAFTSGTTGIPKGTMHFHRDVLIMSDAFPRHVLKPVADDIFCGTPPLAFTFGLGGLLTMPLRAGASVVLMEKLMPDTLLTTIAQTKATVVFTAPTMYRQCALLLKEPAHGFSVPSLKKCVSAGEALPDATRQLWKETTGIEMIDGIGATEMIHIFIAAAGADVKRGAIGKVVPGYVARVVDDNMNPVPAGTLGKLAVKGPTGCRYLADPRQTGYVRQGWNLPGDTFSMDADGYFTYHARSDDMIISAGYNIAGPEVESALLLHPAVHECGVVGADDPERGQIVKAYVVPKPGVEGNADLARALQEFVKSQIAPYKYPRAVAFIDSLPRTETGKLQRYKLRQHDAQTG
jgi:2-aminobenzoate-CoA ligase